VVLVCRSSKHTSAGAGSVIGRKADHQELELAALQACAATLCCGVVYDPSGLNEKGYIYTWLYRLLTTRQPLVAIYLFLMRYVEDLCCLLLPACTMDPVLLDILYGIAFICLRYFPVWQEYQ